MITFPDSARGAIRCLGLAAATVMVLSAAPVPRAQALSLIDPGAMSTAKSLSGGLKIEVHGGHGGGGHGGGGGGGGHGVHLGGGGGPHGGGAVFHAGGFHGGGPVFRGGRFRAGPAIFRGGGHRFGYRHHFHRRYYYGPSYGYPYRRCRIIWTHHGPRRICHFHHWHHRWHHHGFPFRPYW
jgi:hypothetical protein